MKKYFNSALVIAIAFLGTCAFTACSSEDSVTTDNNPTYDPAANTVKTQFVLNIASPSMSSTRQSAVTVQKDHNFRGMEDAILIGLKTGSASSFIAPLINTTSVIVKQSYDLGTLYGNTVVDNEGTNNAENSSRRVVELTLPTGTDAMLVYGRAIVPTNISEETARNIANGKVNVSIDKEAVVGTTFDLVSRWSDIDVYNNTCELAALIMNRILASNVSAFELPTSPTPRNGYTQKADLPALSWKKLASVTDISSLKPLQQNLSKAYKDIIDIYSNSGIHSGSAASIANLIKDINSIATSVANAQATSDEELNAQRLADRILQVIGFYFDANYKFKTIGTLSNKTDESYPIYHLINAAAIPESNFDTNGKYKIDDKYLQGLPTAFNLPDGVAQLQISAITTNGNGEVTGGGDFSYKTATSSSSLIDLNTTINPTKYTYPSELLYFDNSLLRVNDAEKEPSNYPNGYNTWDNGSSWSDWAIGAVASTTRSVAVKNNINYGVAMLQSNVILDGSAFADNRDENVTFTEAEVKKFKLTGVLIGGQFKQLGWNYLASGAANNSDFVIYDNSINGTGVIPTDGTGGVPNYTLVFDNYVSGNQNDQVNVRVALEFQNGDDKDIYGQGGGIIPKGAKFYLVGELKIKDTSVTPPIKELADDKWPTYYAIPPYTDAGATNKITRVFIQDYVTTATFKIGPNSLKNAYTTVPDLRASQTSLGLSVDLNWREGLSFTVDL